MHIIPIFHFLFKELIGTTNGVLENICLAFPAVMMKADSDCPKFRENENLSVPPGFVSLTSFILRRGGNVKKNDNSATTFPVASEQEPICMKTKLDTNDINAYSQGLTRRPWINMDLSNHHKPEESHTKHLPMVKLGILHFFG